MAIFSPETVLMLQESREAERKARNTKSPTFTVRL
jgi:hypothetical protein